VGALRTIYLKAVTTIARGLGLSDPRLYHFMGSGITHAGENVTVGTALTLDAVWACVRLIAQTIATLPLQVYQQDDNGQAVIARQHPLYALLHDIPNADMTATEFWEALAASILLWGNGYAAIERGAGGRIVAVTPMRPDRVNITRQEDGSLRYAYNYMGFIAYLEEGDVMHIKGFSLDGLFGMSPIQQGMQSIATSLAAERAAGSLWRNGMRPAHALIAPAYLNDTQRERYKTKFQEEYAGAVNAGRVPLIEGGWKLEQLSLPPEDAQLLASRQFQVETICRWFDVPPTMIGHMTRSTAWGSGMEQMMLWFLTFALRPHLKRIEQCIAKSLVSAQDRANGFYAEFNVEGLLRADSAGRAALYAVLADHGLRTRNELRALDNMPPLPGGDDLTVAAGMVPIQEAADIAKTSAVAQVALPTAKVPPPKDSTAVAERAPLENQ
jgi:HK97 family phage portal protein